jgi:(4-O-methyl)-D-glucuronate---lignin esterase
MRLCPRRSFLKRIAGLTGIAPLLEYFNGGLSGRTLRAAVEGTGNSEPVSKSSADLLADGFRRVPELSRIRAFWWWLNGNVNKAAILRDLTQMKAAGMAGAVVYDAGGPGKGGNEGVPDGPEFGSPAWIELFRYAISSAHALGLEMGLNVQSGWNLGGPTVLPDDAMKKVTFSQMTVKGPGSSHMRLPMPPTKEGFYRGVAVLAYPMKSGRPKPKPLHLFAQKAAYADFGTWSAPDCTPLLEGLIPHDQGSDADADFQINELINLSGYTNAQGDLRWQVPAGEWEILRFGYTLTGAKVSTSSGKWQGLSIDYLSQSAFNTYWRTVMDPVLEAVKPYLGNTLKWFETDSWEMGQANWTVLFPQEFKDRRGYDITPYLPALAGRIVQSRSITNRFLYDFRKTIGECIADNHYGHFASTAHRYGVQIRCESGGPHEAPIQALTNLGKCDWPMTECWAPSPHRPTLNDRFFGKEAACAAHIYGKRFAFAEMFTGIGRPWQGTPRNLKSTFDRSACEGLNAICWHQFTCSPAEMGLPGQEYFADTHIDPQTTWWKEAPAFVDYLNRCQFMLQQGLFVADVVYYQGGAVPNYVQRESFDPALVLPGYDYDVMDEVALLTRTSVRNKRIVLPDGMSYRLMVIHPSRVMSLPAMKKIAELARAGATIVGPKLLQTPGLQGYPQSDSEIQRIADEMWDPCDGKSILENRYGLGRIIWGKTARQVLVSDAVPADFTFTGAKQPKAIRYIHRSSGEDEIYFVCNLGEASENVTTSFRVAGKHAELWCPASGKVASAHLYENGSLVTRLPLHLDPNGSVFVVFRRHTSTRHHFTSLTVGGRAVYAPEASLRNSPEGGVELCAAVAGTYQLKSSAASNLSVDVGPVPAALQLTGPWRLTFPPNLGAPPSAKFERLELWSRSAVPGIRYFSGTAVYSKSLDIPAALVASRLQLVLNLGEVHDLARVRLNDKDLGVIWKPPFTLDVTRVVRPGQNQLEIEVTNTWVNRLIGDASLPRDQQITRTNDGTYKSDSPLEPSGLAGPVLIEVRRLVQVPMA